MGVSRHVSLQYLVFNNSLLYITIHCQINISESESVVKNYEKPKLCTLVVDRPRRCA